MGVSTSREPHVTWFQSSSSVEEEECEEDDDDDDDGEVAIVGVATAVVVVAAVVDVDPTERGGFEGGRMPAADAASVSATGNITNTIIIRSRMIVIIVVVVVGTGRSAVVSSSSIGEEQWQGFHQRHARLILFDY